MDAARVGHPKYNASGAAATVAVLKRAGYVCFAHVHRPDYTFVLPLSHSEFWQGAPQKRRLVPPPPPRAPGARHHDLDAN